MREERSMSLKVFYDKNQVVDQPGHDSPSSGKPKLVLEEWQRRGLPIEICPVTPVNVEQIKLAHHPDFVDGILNNTLENGFSNKSEKVAASLPYTSGSFLSAARDALKTGTVACSPTSGFHHASHAKAEGFCTFNGLMISALTLKQEGLVERVGILDLDHHYGNGTADIIQRLGIDWITHYTIGAERLYFQQPAPQDPNMTQAEYWMTRLPSICRSYKDCDVVFFQAGGDLWEGDPYAWHGGLSVEQMAARDNIVFTSIKEQGIPCVWNLAGGYKRDEQGSIAPVLKLHNQTAEACCRIWNNA